MNVIKNDDFAEDGIIESHIIRKQEVINYVKEKVKDGYYPTYRELQKRFDIRHYGLSLIDIYYIGVGHSLLTLPFKKGNGYCRAIIKKELVDYIKNAVKNKYYPSRRELEAKFSIKLDSFFNGINELYASAGLMYIKTSNQQIKEKKAKILTKIVVNKILPKLNLKIIKIRGVNSHGIDILAKDKEDNKIGVELKAYNNGGRVKIKDILQLRRFFDKERLYDVILITTASKIQKNLKIPDFVRIIKYEDLRKILNNDCNCSNPLSYIRNFSVHNLTKKHKEKRRRILSYIKNKFLKENRSPTIKEIEKDLHIYVKSYFKNVLDVYKGAHVKIPRRLIHKDKKIKEEYNKSTSEQVLKWMQKEIKKGHYPSGEDINKKFRINMWGVTNMTKLYSQLGVLPYHKRKNKY